MMKRTAFAFAAAAAFGILPAGANAQQAQTFSVTIDDIQQHPNVLVVSGKLGGAEFSADCGIIPTKGGKALHVREHDGLSLLTRNGFSRTTAIDGSIVLLSPDPKAQNDRSLITVFAENGNAVTKSYPVRADEAPYTYRGPAEDAPQISVSFKDAQRNISGANQICAKVVDDLNNKGKFDTSPDAIAISRAQEAVFEKKRSAYLEALNWR